MFTVRRRTGTSAVPGHPTCLAVADGNTLRCVVACLGSPVGADRQADGSAGRARRRACAPPRPCHRAITVTRGDHLAPERARPHPPSLSRPQCGGPKGSHPRPRALSPRRAGGAAHRPVRRNPTATAGPPALRAPSTGDHPQPGDQCSHEGESSSRGWTARRESCHRPCRARARPSRRRTRAPPVLHGSRFAPAPSAR